MSYNIIIFDLVLTFVAIYFVITSINTKKHRLLKFSLLGLALLFFAVQVISMLTFSKTFGYGFVVNMSDLSNYNVAFNVFLKYVIAIAAGIAAVFFVLLYLAKKFKIKDEHKRFIVLIVATLYLLSPLSVFSRTCVLLFKIFHNPHDDLSYQETFKEITHQDYVELNDVFAIPNGPNKNLVLIILESFEENFLDRQLFGNLADGILELKKNGEYYSKISPLIGADWTMGGIHTMMCGVPYLYGSQSGSSVFSRNTNRLVCLSDVLAKANYNQLFLGGAYTSVSGKHNFLRSHGYSTVFDKNLILKEYPKLEPMEWGIKDYDLFQIAKDKYVQLSKEGKPFNLSILNVTTHAPNGIQDERCRNTQDIKILNSVECVDDLVYDFVEFVRSQPNYKDTVIVIVPDHLQMESAARRILAKKERHLFALFLNTGIKKSEESSILYTDLPSLILGRLNINNNAKFLLKNYDNIPHYNEYIEKNFNKISNFNRKIVK